jgi:2-polyprenyl-6-methoxyphenol hydroxylase-like FAD-dependent oxidoreductase
MGGLAAARVLADHFDQVTILDRDELPIDGLPRRGVPQGRHAHALLAGGLQVIAQLFPGIVDEMLAGGAQVLDFNEGRWFQAGGYRAPLVGNRPVISASRPFLEGNVRRRVRELPNVAFETGVTVDGLGYDGTRVRGVRVRNDEAEWTLAADLVVDCSGRGSVASKWLEQIQFPVPTVDDVRCDMRYATVVLPRRTGDSDAKFAITIESPPHGKHAAFLMPVEGDRWILTIAAGFGASVPSDEASFRAIAATLPAPQVPDLVGRIGSLGPVAAHRLPSSRRRRYERLKRRPIGFVALGDSICSFNPIYGQGMSSAVLQAVALGGCLEQGENDAALPGTFYKRASRVIESPWRIAVGADFNYPECTGPKPVGIDFVNRYMQRVLLAAQVSTEVNATLVYVQNLIAPPSRLLRPSIVRKALRAAREAERRNRRAAATPPRALEATAETA